MVLRLAASVKAISFQGDGDVEFVDECERIVHDEEHSRDEKLEEIKDVCQSRGGHGEVVVVCGSCVIEGF